MRYSFVTDEPIKQFDKDNLCLPDLVNYESKMEKCDKVLLNLYHYLRTAISMELSCVKQPATYGTGGKGADIGNAYGEYTRR